MESSSSRIGLRRGILMALAASCAVGVGITGTLLWTQEHAPEPAKVASSSAVSLPAVAPVMPNPIDAPSVSDLTPPQAALTLGNWNFDHQRWPEAIEQYQAAIQGGIDNPDVRTDLGSAYRFGGQPQKALEEYQLAQKQDPSHEMSLYNQGGLWAFSLNNPHKGVAVWRSYLKKFPHGSSATEARKFIAQQEKKGIR